MTSSAAAASALQDFGAVVVVDRQLVVRHASRNSDRLLGHTAETLVGRSLAVVLADDDVADLRSGLVEESGQVRRQHLTVRSGQIKIRTFDAGGGLVGLDLLPLSDDYAGSAAEAIERVSGWNEQLLEAESVEALVEIATRAAGERTGFDGAWICRMEGPDGTATVISARVPSSTPTALGTRVQASDLPPHAVRVRGRPIPYFVSDLAAEPTELVPAADGLDLTGSSLLLPFPEWLAWLSSVGPRATVGIPIVVGDRLWGWILAHHPSARRVPAAIQAELRLLGAAAGTKMAELLSLEETRERLELSRASVRVLQRVAAADDLATGLVQAGSAFPAICEAASAIVSLGDRTEVAGVALADDVVDQVIEIARRELGQPGGHPVVAHRRFAAPDVPVDPISVAGFAATRLDAHAEHILIWVRGEQRHSVKWAEHEVVGDVPQDELFSGLGERIEEERGSCRPWTPAQLGEISDLREALAEVFVGTVPNRLKDQCLLSLEQAKKNF